MDHRGSSFGNSVFLNIVIGWGHDTRFLVAFRINSVSGISSTVKVTGRSLSKLRKASRKSEHRDEQEGFHVVPKRWLLK
jgi:hypothetical protein